MNVYTSKDFEGHWPVGTALVVVAPDIMAARKQADHALEECGLTPQFVAGDATL